MEKVIMKKHLEKVNKAVIGIVFLIAVLSIFTGIYYKRVALLISSVVYIATIAEQHAAATQEMLATMEEHNISIESIFNVMKKMTISSENLREIVKNK